MSDAADLSSRIADAEHAKAALQRYLAPAFETVIGEYTRRLIKLAGAKPGDTAPVINLAMAIKVAQSVQAHVEALVLDGDLARADLQRVRQIERMSPEARKYV